MSKSDILLLPEPSSSDTAAALAMKVRGYELCRSYLGGTWKQFPIEEFKIEYVRGGMSNYLYRCSLPDHLTEIKDEPRHVMVRIYGQILQESQETVVTDSVLFALLAEKQMGPKLYGVFPGGRIEEYVNSRCLRCHELRIPAIAVDNARHLARIHKLRTPLCKEPKWLFDTLTRYLDEALNNVSFDASDQDKCKKLERLLSFGLSSELQCLRTMLSGVDSPVVFCHNDLQEGNVLYQKSEKDFKLIPIDFEYASYNYRGFDLANHICEWVYDYSHADPPYYKVNNDAFPDTQTQLMFIRAYQEEMGPSGLPCDTEENMMMEIKAYVPASHFFWGLWSIVQAHMSQIEFNYLDYAFVRFEAYFKCKNEGGWGTKNINGC